jgi:hypothetical protein
MTTQYPTYYYNVPVVTQTLTQSAPADSNTQSTMHSNNHPDEISIADYALHVVNSSMGNLMNRVLVFTSHACRWMSYGCWAVLAGITYAQHYHLSRGELIKHNLSYYTKPSEYAVSYSLDYYKTRPVEDCLEEIKLNVATSGVLIAAGLALSVIAKKLKRVVGVQKK